MLQLRFFNSYFAIPKLKSLPVKVYMLVSIQTICYIALKYIYMTMLSMYSFLIGAVGKLTLDLQGVACGYKHTLIL